MFDKCDKQDWVLQDKIDEINKTNKEAGFFSRLMEWNKPKWMVGFALFGALVTGASQPAFGGLLMARCLAYLSIPLDLFDLVYPGKNLEDEMLIYVYAILILAVITFLAMFI